MSFINPSDMVDEDAADLQFPKVNSELTFDNNVITITPDSNTKYITQEYQSRHLNCEFPSKSIQEDCFNNLGICVTCKKQLRHPFIKCAECYSTNLCLKCFANGKETIEHRNFHSYIINHENLEVFPSSGWTVADERTLMRNIEKCGYGNWEDISNSFQKKFTKQQCVEHYHKHYFDGVFKTKLGLTNDYYFPERIPYLYKMSSVDPPRSEINDLFHFDKVDGYRCARGDFEIPYDKSAEMLICEISSSNLIDNDDVERERKLFQLQIEEELKLGVLQAYNNRLKERHRRYEIMHRHGLLLPNKTQSWLTKYHDTIKLHLNSSSSKFGHKINRFSILMQLCSGIAFDVLLESLQYYTELKKYIYTLYELRSNGVTSMYGANLYYRLKKQRLKNLQERKPQENLYNWRTAAPVEDGGENSQFCSNQINISGKLRKKAKPINIIGFPGYDKLTEDERKLCSNVRILPDSYLDFKKILQKECTNVGYLRLADARRLIKIDVNKTRQLYDFLIEKGYCNKPIDD